MNLHRIFHSLRIASLYKFNKSGDGIHPYLTPLSNFYLGGFFTQPFLTFVYLRNNCHGNNSHFLKNSTSVLCHGSNIDAFPPSAFTFTTTLVSAGTAISTIQIFLPDIENMPSLKQSTGNPRVGKKKPSNLFCSYKSCT